MRLIQYYTPPGYVSVFMIASSNADSLAKLYAGEELDGSESNVREILMQTSLPPKVCLVEYATQSFTFGEVPG